MPEQKNASGNVRVRAGAANACVGLSGCAPGGHRPACTRGEAWMDGVPLDDDITLLVIQKKRG
ncbi:MAG: hypothetical protein IPI01_10415 [Ignavibacteriae bacterium]|nr:hypothetical protein [Ignavibacteriota bacterium]